MILNPDLQQAKTYYENLLEYHLSRGTTSFDLLSLDSKKEVSLAYIKTLKKTDQEIIFSQAFERMLHVIPKIITYVFGGEDKKYFASCEMIDQFSVSLMVEVESEVDEDFEKLEDPIEGVDFGIYNEERQLDNAQRTRDANSSGNTSIHLDTVDKIMGWDK